MKSSLNELQVRMREMIEREDDYSAENEKHKEKSQPGELNEFELSMMEKTCD